MGNPKSRKRLAYGLPLTRASQVRMITVFFAGDVNVELRGALFLKIIRTGKGSLGEKRSPKKCYPSYTEALLLSFRARGKLSFGEL